MNKMSSVKITSVFFKEILAVVLHKCYFKQSFKDILNSLQVKAKTKDR